MLNCLSCSKELRLIIDTKDFSVKCKNCTKTYDLEINGRNIKIMCGKHKVDFYLNDLSMLNKELNNKTIYELYNKGYIKCVKTLNPLFSESFNSWELPLKELREHTISNSMKEIESLNSKIKSFDSLQESYACNNCSKVLSFEESLKSNFVCSICSSGLSVFDPSSQETDIMNLINYINSKILTLNNGWC